MSKDFISTTYTFTPGISGVGIVNLSGITGFDVKYLVAIINQTRGITIYATGSQTLKYTNVAGTTVTLFFDTSAMVNTDILQVVYQENSEKVSLASLDSKTQSVKSIGNFYPNTLGTSNNYSSVGDEVSISVDSQGNMLTRSSTDEGSAREPFDGGSIGFSVGTITLTNGLDTITGADLTILERNSYIKLTADAESAWAQVLSIDTPTTGRLYFNYTGTGGAAAAIQSNYKPVTGTGGNIGVASSICTIGAGTTINQFSGITKEVDYGPLTQIALVSVSQRIVNQNIYIGLQNSQTTPTKFARFNLSGTVNTLAVFETTDIKSGTPAGADIETSTFTLPDGLTTASSLRYKIEITSEFCRAYVNDKLVAQHFNNIPAQYNIMDMVIGTLNGVSAPATNTNVLVDSYSLANYNSFKVSVASDQEKIVANRAMPIVYGPSNVTANNTNFFVIDCSQFACVGLYVSSIGGGATIVFQESNDITFVTGVTDVSANAVGTGGGVSNFAAGTGNVIIPVLARYLRVRTSGYVSGTITCTAFGYQQEPFFAVKTTTYNGTQTVTANNNAGTAAHSAGSSGNPVRIGGRCITTIDTTLVQGDACDLAMTSGMQAITKAFSSVENDLHYVAAASGIVNSTTAVTMFAAQAAGVRNYLTSIEISNDTLGAATELVIRNGAAGAVLWRIKLDTTISKTTPITFPTPISTSAATLMEIACLTASITGGVYVNAHGYRGV